MYIVKTWTSHNNITEHTVTVIHVCMCVCVCGLDDTSDTSCRSLIIALNVEPNDDTPKSIRNKTVQGIQQCRLFLPVKGIHSNYPSFFTRPHDKATFIQRTKCLIRILWFW